MRKFLQRWSGWIAYFCIVVAIVWGCWQIGTYVILTRSSGQPLHNSCPHCRAIDAGEFLVDGVWRCTQCEAELRRE